MRVPIADLVLLQAYNPSKSDDITIVGRRIKDNLVKKELKPLL